jgi:predicted  nucleic acid-binding Zn-ribbon protein
MGPTNVALVKLFRADQQLREAQERLDAAAKNVRVQERRVNDLSEKLKAAQTTHRQQQSHSGQLDLDLKTRDGHIEKLRTQQQAAKNNKEYQAFLVEINTQKVDRNKVEEEALKLLETVEKSAGEATALSTQLETERAKLETMRTQIGDTIAALQAEVESLQPAREEAAAALPPRAREAFERLAEHHDGEAMAAIAKPDRRREEYLCTACTMDLVADVYNKLHSRDELVYCPSCRRILYIPEDLPPETAINTKPAPRPVSTRTRGAKGGAGGDASASPSEAPVVIEQRAKGRIGMLLTAAQGESVQAAVVSGQNPVDCEVRVNGELLGQYKCKDVGHLERIIRYRMEEAGLKGEPQVTTAASAPATNETEGTGESSQAPSEGAGQGEQVGAGSGSESGSEGASQGNP